MFRRRQTTVIINLQSIHRKDFLIETHICLLCDSFSIFKQKSYDISASNALHSSLSISGNTPLQLTDKPCALCQVFGFCGRRSLGGSCNTSRCGGAKLSSDVPKEFPTGFAFWNSHLYDAIWWYEHELRKNRGGYSAGICILITNRLLQLWNISSCLWNNSVFITKVLCQICVIRCNRSSFSGWLLEDVNSETFKKPVRTIAGMRLSFCWTL